MTVVWLTATVGAAWFLAHAQQHNRNALRERFASRVTLGSEFASLYVSDLFQREHAQATTLLAARHVSADRFAQAALGLGLNSAVLLDSSGHLLQVSPSKPALRGLVMTTKYAHLAAAVAGHTAVSDVVPSAALALPVVALAMPYATPSGRRVFSGAYRVSKTPLGGYLKQLLITPGHHVYLVDAAGTVITASEALRPGVTTLAQADPRLASADGRASHGKYDAPSGRQEFVGAPVSGTPWRIVAEMPQAQLFSSISGAGQWFPWLAIAVLGVAGLAIIALISGLRRGRTRVELSNARLDRLAHLDALTGLRNRHTINRTLVEALSASRRHGLSLSVLMIDIDHFKRINDTLGHDEGDAALCHVARLLEDGLRTEDVIVRWGGEEFLVILPATDEDAAADVAERLRASVADAPPAFAITMNLPVTVTIGVAGWTDGTPEDLVARADTALYAGKTAGRNIVQVAAPPSLHPAVSGSPTA